MEPSPPLLLLPSANGEFPRFYSLAKKKVITLDRKREDDDGDAQFVGSSHGWIALFESCSERIILWNPFPATGEKTQLKLPRVTTVVDLPYSSKMMIAGPGQTLLFISPATSLAWTPLGNLLVSSDTDSEESPCPYTNCDINFSNSHEDVVYSEVKKEFYTIKRCTFQLEEEDTLTCVVDVDVWAWDLFPEGTVDGCDWEAQVQAEEAEPAAQECYYYHHRNRSDKEEGKTLRWVTDNKSMLKDQCVQIPHIVVFGEETYIALQFVQLMKSKNNEAVDQVPMCPYRGLAGYFHSKTCGFIVFKVNTTTDTEEEEGNMEIVEDLGGLAMFVGLNNSIAVRASKFGDGLINDSIYFADSKRIKRIYGRMDNGCFDYLNKKLTHFAIDEEEVGGGKSDYYYEDKLKSSPIWFVPAASASASAVII
ncbi:hypothetical protein OROGR_028781 [Orobanche gracilis]